MNESYKSNVLLADDQYC